MSKNSTFKYRVGIVTCKLHSNLASDDQSLNDAFRIKSIFNIKVCVWNDPNVNWSEFHCLVFRSVWDYVENIDSFLKWLRMIKNLEIYCLNPPDIIKWNTHKRYLCDLYNNQIDTIPTLYVNTISSSCIHGIDKLSAHRICQKSHHCLVSKSKPTKTLNLQELVEKAINEEKIFDQGQREFVFKPCVGANSYGTCRFSLDNWEEYQDEFEKLSKHSDMMIQPFAPSIMTEGELSFIFFNCEFSHSINKRTARDEFRVQTEFGGTTAEFIANAEQIAHAKKAIDVIKRQFKSHFLYARIDMIRYKGTLCIGETELFEPTLYFENDEKLTSKFVDALTCFLEERYLKSPHRFAAPMPSIPIPPFPSTTTQQLNSGNTTPDNISPQPSSICLDSTANKTFPQKRPNIYVQTNLNNDICDPAINLSPSKKRPHPFSLASIPPSPPAGGFSLSSGHLSPSNLFWSQSPLPSPRDAPSLCN